MLATDLRHDLVRTVLEPLEATDAAWAQARYAEMQHEIASILPGEGTPLTHRAVDLRYLGQEHTVTTAVTDLADWADLRKQFDDAHERAYGYAATDVDVQLLNLRLTVRFAIERPRLPRLSRPAGARAARVRYGEDLLAAGRRLRRAARGGARRSPRGRHARGARRDRRVGNDRDRRRRRPAFGRRAGLSGDPGERGLEDDGARSHHRRGHPRGAERGRGADAPDHDQDRLQP